MTRILCIILLFLAGFALSRAATVQTKGAFEPPLRVVISNINYSVSTEQMWSRNQLMRSLVSTNERLFVRSGVAFKEVRYTVLRGTLASPRDYPQYLLTDMRGTKISHSSKFYVRPDLYRSPPNPAAGQSKSLVKSAPVPFVAPQLWLTWEQQRGVTLLWDRNPETNVVGYRVYRGRASRSYDTVTDAGNNIRAGIEIITWGFKDYFAVTAYDNEGLESPFSDEVTYAAPPVAPWLLGLVRTQPTNSFAGRFAVESKSNINDAWTTLATPTNNFLPVTAAGNKIFRVETLP